MRIILRGLLVLLIASSVALVPAWPALAANLETIADHVLCQPDFTHNLPGAVSATSLNAPFGLALDAHGDLYIADVFNSRVLEYDRPLPLLPLFLPLIER